MPSPQVRVDPVLYQADVPDVVGKASEEPVAEEEKEERGMLLWSPTNGFFFSILTLFISKI